MFSNMKNKIREKTGTELPKFSTHSASLFGKKSNQHSRQSSQGSINSAVSDLSVKEDGETKSTQFVPGNVRSDASRTVADDEEPTSGGETEFYAKLTEKEEEWRDKEKQYVADLIKQTKELQEALCLAEEWRKQLQRCQEEKLQLELYQKQEVTKIKQLLFAKEEENSANVSALKEALATVESLKTEVNRLKPLEGRINTCQDDLECLRHTSERERWALTSQLAQKDETIRRLEERISVLTHRTEADCQALGAQLTVDERVRSLVAERALLERRLEEAHVHLSEIKTSWSNKIAILETQVGRLSRQAGEEGVERRNAEEKIVQLENKLERFSKEKEITDKKLEKLTKERDDLASEVKELSSVHAIRDDDDHNHCHAKLTELNERLELLRKENEALKLSNEECRRIYDESLSKERNKNNALKVEMAKIEEYSQELALVLQKEKDVKDNTLLRNAEMSQMVQLAEQELKQLQMHNEEQYKKIIRLEEQLETTEQEMKKNQAADKKETLEKTKHCYEKEIANEDEKNLNNAGKAIRDNLKNSIAESSNLYHHHHRRRQQPPHSPTNNIIGGEERIINHPRQHCYGNSCGSSSSNNNNNNNNNDGNAVAVTTAGRNTSSNECSGDGNPDEGTNSSLEDDINFKYMKHVLIKFLTSSEYEAHQLTKVVATLLKLNSEEERLIKDTLDWRWSWFGSKPRVKLSRNPS